MRKYTIQEWNEIIKYIRRNPIVGCIDCEHIKQGKTSAICGNPKQTNKELKSYVYADKFCNLFELRNKKYGQ